MENFIVFSRYLVREYCETYLHRMYMGKVVIMMKKVVLTVTIPIKGYGEPRAHVWPRSNKTPYVTVKQVIQG